jgi:hypothetical protein
MHNSHTKSERKLIRQLASTAWERQLREELKKIGGVLSEMESGHLSPFDADAAVHAFHNGVSRELYNRYSDSDPWFAVCRAHFDGVLTDEDLSGASDNIRAELKQFADRFQPYIVFVETDQAE